MFSEKPQAARITLPSHMLNLCTRLGRTQHALLSALFDRLATEHDQGLLLGIDDLPWLPPLKVWCCGGVRLVYRVSGNRVHIISIDFDPLPPSGGPAKASRSPILQSISDYTYWNYYAALPMRYALNDNNFKPLIVIVMEDARMTAINFTDTLVIQYLSDRPPVLGGAQPGGRYEVLYSYEPEPTICLLCWLILSAARAYDDAITISVAGASKGIGMTIDVRDFVPARHPYNPATAVTNPCSTPAGAFWSDVIFSQLCEVARTKLSYDEFFGGSGISGGDGIGMTTDMQHSACRIYDLLRVVTTQCFTPPQALGLAEAAWLLSCDFAQKEGSCDDFFEPSGISDSNGIETRIDMHDFAFDFNQMDLLLAEMNPCFTPQRAFGIAAWLLPCDIARWEVVDDILEAAGITATTSAGSIIHMKGLAPVGRHRYDPSPATTDLYFETPRASGLDDTSWCMSPCETKPRELFCDDFLYDIGLTAANGAGSSIDMKGFVPVGRHRYDPPSVSTDLYFRTPRASGLDDTSWCLSPRDLARKKKSYCYDDLKDIGVAAPTCTGTMIGMHGFAPAGHLAIPPARVEMTLQ